MKDGELVESGTHQSLVDLQGEYFKLYNIQAQAFTNPKTETASEGELTNDRRAAHLTTKPPKSGFTERGVGKCSDPVKKVL